MVYVVHINELAITRSHHLRLVTSLKKPKQQTPNPSTIESSHKELFQVISVFITN